MPFLWKTDELQIALCALILKAPNSLIVYQWQAHKWHYTKSAATKVSQDTCNIHLVGFPPTPRVTLLSTYSLANLFSHRISHQSRNL